MSTLDKKRINAVRKLEELGYRFNDNGMKWENKEETKQHMFVKLPATSSYHGINLAPNATTFIPSVQCGQWENFGREIVHFWGRCVQAQDKILVIDLYNMLNAVKSKWGL